MKALQIRRRSTRIGLARVASAIGPAAATRVGPLEYRTIDEPELPGPGWHHVSTRLSGICGSDLSMIEGHASVYFDDWVSFPFVPGHEIVGQLDDGRRVVIEPVLGHEAHGVVPPGPDAAPGDGDDYAHLIGGGTNHLEAGIQTGFCASTGGGWSPVFVAHESQLHPIPDTLSDEAAVLVEPLAGGIHAALKVLPTVTAAVERGQQPVVAVIGAGTMGLAIIAGLARYVPEALIVVGARYRHQRQLAAEFGAEIVVDDTELLRAVRRQTGAHLIGDALSSGAHACIDAIGSNPSIELALRLTRPRGRVVLLGMPARVDVDLTALWHRETELVGAYTYGTEVLGDGGRRRGFELAIETAAAIGAERLVSATYRLDEYRDAIAHAAEAGRRGAIKIAFDLRGSAPAVTEQGAT